MSLLCWLVACGTPAAVEAPVEPKPVEPVAAAPADPSVRLGRVLETLEGGGYAFARMDACGQEAWVAGPPAKFEVGAVVEMKGGIGMEGFKSEALNRTFDQILFVDAWKPSAAEPACGAAPPALPDDVRVGEVAEVLASGGYTYARLNVCGTEVWVAGPETPVEVGTFAASPTGMEMKDFTSESLGRTFPSVHFVTWIKRSRVPPTCP